MKIVIVEDEIRIREGIARLIKKINPEYRVVGEAEDGKEGFRVIMDRKPDLVITDIKMDGMDGLEMLYRVREAGLAPKAVVLSAYSDFSCAQEAIKLGVCEYLLKPITITDLSCALKNIENRLLGEKQLAAGGQQGSLETVLYSLLHGSPEIDERTKAFLREKYSLDSDGFFALAPVYLDKSTCDNRKATGMRIDKILGMRKDMEYRILELTQENELLVVIYNMKDKADLQNWMQSFVIPEMIAGGLRGFSCGWIVFDKLSECGKALKKIRPCLDWNIVYGTKTLVTVFLAEQSGPLPVSYPLATEREIRSALCLYDRPRFMTALDEFLQIFRSGPIHDPKEIKETFIRFLWAVFTAAREIDYEQYSCIPQQDILEGITAAVTRPELEFQANKLLTLLPDKKKQEDSEVAIVNRARNLIHEFYANGITLNEIASRINVTPEYLSTLFHRTNGLNFGKYIKNHRIQKAKELLMGTDQRVSEIGEKVGYGDPKYFSRVFREVTGTMPSDFRKNNR